MRLSVILRISSLLIFLMTLSLTFGACEPSIEIQVHNQTDKPLQIFTGDTFVGDAAPGEEVKFGTPAIFPKYKIIAKDMDGNTVYTANFTGEDMKGKKTYRVVIPATARGEQSDNNTGR